MYMKFCNFIGALSLIVCMVFTMQAYGLMLGLSTEKLTRDAELIITGNVEDTTAQWATDKKSIITTSVISVQEVIKGRAVEKKIQVIYPGGEVGEIGMKVSDEAPLQKGERVLLYLTPENQFSNGSAYRISGRAQGKYTIGDDMIARKRGFAAVAGDEHMDTTIPLETLKEKIRTYVDEK
jgi:hypothetical protein